MKSMWKNRNQAILDTVNHLLCCDSKLILGKELTTAREFILKNAELYLNYPTHITSGQLKSFSIEVYAKYAGKILRG